MSRRLFGARPGFVPAGDVHVWHAWLDQPEPVVAATARLLSSDEIERANRGVGVVRRRRILARGALRTALGRYLEVAPERVSFAYDPLGKPELASPRRRRHPLFFSVSHSGDCCLVAVAQSDVGIDVEKLERRQDLDALAERYFAPEEAIAIKRLRGDSKVGAFFRCWTCKEALIKAMGGGLATRALDGLVVSLDGDVPALVASEYGDPRNWSLAMMGMEAPWIAAIALRRPSGSGLLAIRIEPIEAGAPAARPREG